MRRRESFATAGTRIGVRFFGGWNSDNADAVRRDKSKIGYTKGVPTGADLRVRPPSSKAPVFIIWVVKDPGSGNLDRIQIINGWAKNGQTFEKIHDVAWSPQRKADPKTGEVLPVGNPVDVSKATDTKTIGATALSAVWTDPEFRTIRRTGQLRLLGTP